LNSTNWLHNVAISLTIINTATVELKKGRF
jgi:hypothetical protein